jgi:hypothetical protein
MRFTACLCVLGGCAADARVDLSAADALTAVAGQVQRTIQEYHGEVVRFDDSRESATVAAFVTRVKADAADEASLDAHAAQFAAALVKIRADRETEWSRRAAAMENVGVLREMASGLRKLALQSLSLDDEVRRYLASWVSTKTPTGNEAGNGSGTRN